MKTITITITSEGETTIETKGFVGAACKDATAALEKALGMKTKDAPTKEANQKVRVTG
jgi:hypothetical protein